MVQRIQRLLIVAECEHIRRGSVVFGPDHFRAEIEEWAKYVDMVRLLTNFPPSEGVPPGWGPYQVENIEVLPAQGAFGSGVMERFRSIGRSVAAFRRIMEEFAWADAVHLRGPTRNALLALWVSTLRARPVYFKWAGEWGGDRLTGVGAAIQRKMLRTYGREMVVTVYDRCQADPDWIFVSDTSGLTRRQIERGLVRSRPEWPGGPIPLLWVGRFTPNKNVSLLLHLVRALREERRVELELHLVGDGPLKHVIETEARQLQVASSVAFHGTLGWEKLADLYASAKLLLLPSGTEGFPKVVHEALLFGTPVVAFGVGAVPRMLENRGLAVPREHGFEGFVGAVWRLLAEQDLWQECSENGRRWAGNISIEDVVARHVATCESRWGCRFSRKSAMDAGIPGWGVNAS